ncbi:YSIRK-type signal peptide-containing protein [Dolosigranulum savutiense]|uniref:YSIRK-type signal peptide-containing protein n=1 Tax=Dolosigranulum savutiense TaxID=3110288 RepID=A0AB74TLB1_9LACT
MVGKNNKTGQFRRQANEDKRYTLKKLSVGLASVALGTVLLLGQANAVNAEEVDSDIEDNLPDDFTDEEAAERRAEEDILLSEAGDNAEAPVEKTVFQFSYMEAGTGKKMDGFFGEYVNANEAEKAFRMYASEAGYTLENIQFDNHNSFTATIAQNSTDRYVETAKGRARNLINDLDGLTDELKADYLEQVGAAVSVEEVEAVYNEAVEVANQQKEEANRYVAVAKDRARQLIKDLTNLTNDQKTHYLAKVEAATSVAEVEAIHAEAESVVNETPAPNRFVKIAKNHARQLINKLGNLYDNQKADYIKRVNAADSVKTIEGILEEAQKHVNSAKGGENGQAPTQPNKPSYDGEITPTPEAPAESELDQAKMKATEDIKALGYFTAKEKQDLLGRVKDYDNTGDIHFIVTKAQQENNKRDQLHRKLLELQFGTNPNNSLPEAGKHDKANPGDILNSPDKITLEVAKAKAIDTITHLEHFSREDLATIKAEINHAKTTEEVSKIVMLAKEENTNRGTVEKNKTGAKDYLSKEFGKDLDTMQRNAYARAIDKIKNNDPNYEKKVQDIVQVAIAEVLVSKAESGRHIEKAKEALAAASKETEGGKLIDAKDTLIKNLQERLNKVTNKPQAPKVPSEIKAAKDKLEEKIKKGIADKDMREKFLKELNKKANIMDINALQAEVEKELKVQEVKDGAKSYLTNGIADQDLPKAQKAKYEKALSKITSADTDYAQKIQDIIQVATAESLVARAEKGHHIEAAEEAVTKAAKITKGGQLIDGKDQLIMSLQTRLAKVISEQDQTDQTPPSVEKQPEKEQTPPVEKDKEKAPSTEKEKESSPEEAQHLKEKKETLRSFINTIQSLTTDQKTFYLEWLESSKSVKQIDELFELFDAETYLAREKNGDLPKEQVIPAVKDKLSRVTDKELQGKKAELLKQLASLEGTPTTPAERENDQTAEVAPGETYKSQRDKVLDAAKKLSENRMKLNNKDSSVTLADYQKQFEQFKKMVSDLKKLAQTENEKKDAVGIEVLIKNFNVQ